jgi:NADH-quinone oxidoreductase subunit A
MLVPSLGIVAYLALFTGVGILFLFANLVVGRFVRPSDPHPEKQKIYECGEPAVGSSFVQFDLRFYVVALLFIIFDVEVAFFFPWAAVFGKATNLADGPNVRQIVQTVDGDATLGDEVRLLYQELGIRDPSLLTQTPETLVGKLPADTPGPAGIVKSGASQLAWLTIIDIVVFFAVLMIGFAYVWKRGDLDWVRATSREPARRETPPGERSEPETPVLSA